MEATAAMYEITMEKQDDEIRKEQFKYENRLSQYRKNITKLPIWEVIKNNLNIDIDSIPIFLDVEISSDFVFNCDRIIWQSKIFNKFIYRRRDKEVKISNVVKWVQKHSGLPLNRERIYIPTKRLGEYDLTDIVFEYFDKLCTFGIVRWKHKGHKFGSSVSIILENYKVYKNMKRTELWEYSSNIQKKGGEELEKEKNMKQGFVSSISKLDGSDLDVYEKPSVTKDCFSKVDICRICEVETDNWIIYYGEDKTCVCRKCRLGGRG